MTSKTKSILMMVGATFLLLFVYPTVLMLLGFLIISVLSFFAGIVFTVRHRDRLDQGRDRWRR